MALVIGVVRNIHAKQNKGRASAQKGGFAPVTGLQTGNLRCQHTRSLNIRLLFLAFLL
jgi:hypothetical protein